MGILVLQNTGQVLALKQTQTTVAGAHVLVQMLIVEIIKGLLGLSAHWWSFGELNYENVRVPKKQILKCSVPVVLYAIQNNLLFVAAKGLSVSVYQALAQLKVDIPDCFSLSFSILCTLM